MNLTNILIIYLVIINLAAFFIFGIDKRRAIKNRWRIAESTLFLLALIGGSIGAEAGMSFCDRHSINFYSPGSYCVLYPEVCIKNAAVQAAFFLSI